MKKNIKYIAIALVIMVGFSSNFSKASATTFDYTSYDLPYTVVNTNVPPIANAGADKILTQPANSATVVGSGTDSDGTIVAYKWSQIRSAPSVATIASPNSAVTNIGSLSKVGVYTFQLIVTDNKGAQSFPDTMTITVKTSVGNIPPVANAGPDQTITLPANSVSANGSGTDSDGTIVAYKWSQVGSAPSVATISSPNSASTSITNLIQGTYTFQLTVTDNQGATGTDSMTITVNPVLSTPPAPSGVTATAGACGSNAITVFWNASSGASSYNILRSTTSGSGYTSIATSVASSPYVDNSGLVAKKTYYYVVQAVNSSGTSGNSSQVSAVAPDTTCVPPPPGGGSYNVTACAAPSHLTITPAGTTIVKSGKDSPTYNIVPDTGYTLNSLIIDSASIAPVSTYQFTNVTKDHTICAKTKLKIGVKEL